MFYFSSCSRYNKPVASTILKWVEFKVNGKWTVLWSEGKNYKITGKGFKKNQLSQPSHEWFYAYYCDWSEAVNYKS